MYSMQDETRSSAAGASSDRLFDLIRSTIQPDCGTSIAAQELFAILDGLPDTLFFLKDSAGRYTHVNLTMMWRLGLRRREDAIGRTPGELYPAPLGESYIEQDRRVLHGQTIENLLELQLFPNREPGWCLTHKRPLRQEGTINGLIGISRDLSQQDSQQPIYTRLRTVIVHLQNHYTQNLRIQALADQVDMSLLQLERHFKRVFQLTPQQMLTKLRVEQAMRLLRGPDSIADIGQACGFADQSAFTRQFKATAGMTPRDYRSSTAPVPAINSQLSRVKG